MLFNSISFAIFLPIVFGLYWLIDRRNVRLQNVLLLAASYFFYSCWDWRFLFLLIFSTLLDYFSGLMMEQTENQSRRRSWFWISVIINLGFLGVFKYFNFFTDTFTSFLNEVGFHVNPLTIDIILPVGISFYTFHGLSYVIDVYNKKISAERDFVDYAVFVSFFPLLVAGPIERATHLLPQIKKIRHFDYSKAVSGLRQILWGLFKKIVIADNCAVIVNQIFESPSNHSGSTLLLGAVLFAFQIYGDFSGYSDIALGTARLFGIDLLKNFSFPYFSRNVAEFWRRWHISLSSWFRDYIYIPLGGSRGNKWNKIRNTFIIFLISGLWHGANWTFIIWGFIHATLVLMSSIWQRQKTSEIVAAHSALPSLKELMMMIRTFILITLAFIFFRSDSISVSLEYLTGIFSSSLFTLPLFKPKALTLLLLFFILIEWAGRRQNFAIEALMKHQHYIMRNGFYMLIIMLIVIFGGSEQEFIYFQF